MLGGKNSLCLLACVPWTPFHPLKPQDLKDFMRQAGEITFADAHKQRVGEG